MAAERISNQTVVLFDCTKVTSKTVRRASHNLFAKLTRYPPQSSVLGTAKVRGYEIPVECGRGRNGPWYQAGTSRRNRA